MLLLGQSLAAGILLGGLYSIIALGLSMTWGMLKVINLAHFSFVFLAAYVTYQLSVTAGLDPFLAMLVTAPLFFLFGVTLQLLFNQFEIDEFTSLLVTFGLFIILESVMSIIWSADYRTIPTDINPYSINSIWVGEIALPIAQLGAFIGAIVLAVGTRLLMTRTYAGKAFRAISQDQEMASAFGINSRRMSLLLAGLSTAYAGIAGTFVAMIFVLFPAGVAEFIGVIFAVVILGGIGNTAGTFAAGILIGVTQSLTSAIGGPALAPLVTFSLLIVALLFRPEGLFTRKATL